MDVSLTGRFCQLNDYFGWLSILPTNDSQAESSISLMGDSSQGSSPSQTEQAKQQQTQEDSLQLYKNVKDKPLRVDHIRYPENIRTRRSVLEHEFEQVRSAETLEELREALVRLYVQLEALDIFSEVQVSVDAGVPGNDKKNIPDFCDLNVDVKEKGVFSLNAGTYVSQNSEGSVEVTMGLRNLSGYAEHANLSAEFGSQFSREFAFHFWNPRFWTTDWTSHLKVHQMYRRFMKYSSYEQQLRGIQVYGQSPDKKHDIGYELDWYTLRDPTARSSKAVRAQLGHHLKSAVHWAYLYDTRDNFGRPSSGFGVRNYLEVSGFTPDISAPRYVKNRIDFQIGSQLTKWLTCTVDASCGILLPWNNSDLSKPSLIYERFFVGGMQSLRGFNPRGIGPKDPRRRVSDDEVPARDFLGGDLFATVLGSLNFDIPLNVFRSFGIYGQVFINGANVIQLGGSGRTIHGSLEEFTRSWRWSTGVGLVWPTNLGKFEINYVHVLKQQEHDSVKRGFSMGFATSPLYSAGAVSFGE
eukprot:TRINITY_DN5347_c0_g1_i4.p1 TRINITY_DN5347_c0_g1~~TRINITY_DN5347_c0_g1_i4.p1  ORF type:complete len:525 (+),score=49.54 TRINITY_DN5347_c0_g1_i4:827-2401(+)